MTMEISKVFLNTIDVLKVQEMEILAEEQCGTQLNDTWYRST